jgi:hypothetical protein
MRLARIALELAQQLAVDRIECWKFRMFFHAGQDMCVQAENTARV